VHRWLTILERGCGLLVLGALVFAPWAYGATTLGSIQALSVTGWAALGLSALCFWLRRKAMEPPPREHSHPSAPQASRWLAGMTILVLAYVLVSAINARATAELGPAGVHLVLRPCVHWLPHSYDAPRTWRALGSLLGLLGYFCALLQWLSPAGQAQGSHHTQFPTTALAATRTATLRWRVGCLIWVLSVNGAALATEGIVQKVSATDQLLFFAERWTAHGDPQSARTSFGPYPYQTNGAQFCNLLWPLPLGWWWVGHQREKNGNRPHRRLGTSPDSLLPAFATIMVGGAFAAGSRGGNLIAALQIAAIIVWAWRQRDRLPRHLGMGLLLTTLAGIGLGAWTGWEKGWSRFQTIVSDRLSGRIDTYARGLRMRQEFDPWGSGADSFHRLHGLYVPLGSTKWDGYMHNDWLETWVTYGSVGALLLLGLGGAVVWRWRTGPHLPLNRNLPFFVALPLSGLLIHAFADLPFQIYSLHLTFVVLLAFGVLLRTGPAAANP